MALERCYSLRQAAKIIGIDRDTIKKELVLLGLVPPSLPRGAKMLIRESDLEMIIRKRSPKRDWSLLRTGNKSNKGCAA